MPIVTREKAIELFGVHYPATIPTLDVQGPVLTATIIESLGKVEDNPALARPLAAPSNLTPDFNNGPRAYPSRIEAEIQYRAALKMLGYHAEAALRQVQEDIEDKEHALQYDDLGVRDYAVQVGILKEMQERAAKLNAQMTNRPNVTHVSLPEEIRLPYLVACGTTIYRVTDKNAQIADLAVADVAPVRAAADSNNHYGLRYQLVDANGVVSTLVVNDSDSLGDDTLARYFDNKKLAEDYAEDLRKNPRQPTVFAPNLRF